MATAIVGAYWDAREESRQACAERLLAFFDALGHGDTAPDTWFQKMAKQRDPLKPIPGDVAGLIQVLREVFDDSYPPQPMVDVGYSFGAWNGPNAAAPASIVCSLGASSQLVGNRFVLTCDDQTTPDSRLREYCVAAVGAFDPDVAVVHNGVTLKNAHERMNQSEAMGRRLSIRDVPALYVYRRGLGFDWGGMTVPSPGQA